MESFLSRLEQIDARLSDLEKRDKAKDDEILKLKNENAELKAQMYELNRPNVLAMRNVEDNSTEIEGMKSEIRQLSGHKDELDDTLCKMEIRNETLEKCVRQNDDRLQQIHDLYDKEDAVKTEIDKRKTSAFWCCIKPSQPLLEMNWTKLDHCELCISPGVHFHKDSCEYEINQYGLYGLDVYIIKEGMGKLRVRVRFDDGWMRLGGNTSSDRDVIRDFFVLPLAKGTKVALEVIQQEGQAQILLCNFSAFLISPLENPRKPQP